MKNKMRVNSLVAVSTYFHDVDMNVGNRMRKFIYDFRLALELISRGALVCHKESHFVYWKIKSALGSSPVFPLHCLLNISAGCSGVLEQAYEANC